MYLVADIRLKPGEAIFEEYDRIMRELGPKHTALSGWKLTRLRSEADPREVVHMWAISDERAVETGRAAARKSQKVQDLIAAVTDCVEGEKPRTMREL
jgi:hypothetical protein